MQTRILAKPARRSHEIVVRHRSGDEEVIATATVARGLVTLSGDIVVGRSGNRAAGIVLDVRGADAKDIDVAISGLLALRELVRVDARERTA